ncbi:MAG: VCBS repeat-containing protein [Bacteroidales bacterium]|nr:VCBS repeat-containing protein [Bacteroidales bacterium]
MQNAALVTTQTRGGLKSIANTTPLQFLGEATPEYIVITCDSLIPAFSKLIEWRKDLVYRTIVKSVESIYEEYKTGSKIHSIKAYLDECYENWGTLYILFGGDIDIVPSRLKEGYYSQLYAYDYFFSEKGNGHTHLFSRIPAQNSQEAKVIIDKIITYEKGNFYNPSYINNYIGILGPISSYDINYKKRDLYKKNKSIDVNNYYIVEDLDCVKYPSSNCQVFPQDSAVELNSLNMLKGINGELFNNTKFHIVYHEDHSLEDNFGASAEGKRESIYIRDIETLDNFNGLYQVVLSNGCCTSNFSLDCIAESYIKHPNSGCVAFFGNSNVGWSDRKIYNTFINEVFNNNINIVSELFNLIIKKVNHYDMAVLGDPLTSVWTKIPKTLSVNVGNITNDGGYTLLPISVTNLQEGEVAEVTIRKGDDIFAKAEINSTDNNKTFAFLPHTNDSITISLTSLDYKPVIIKVADIIAENRLTLGEYEDIVFTTENPIIITDGAIAGAITKISLPIVNRGTTQATGVYATLRYIQESLSDTIITILDSIHVYGDILSGVEVTKEFTIITDKDAETTLRNGASNGNKLQLLINDSEGNSYTETFKINVYAPEIDIVDYSHRSTNVTLTFRNKAKAPVCLNYFGGTNNVVDSTTVVNFTPVTDYYIIEAGETLKRTFKVTKSTLNNNIHCNIVVKSKYGQEWRYEFNTSDRISIPRNLKGESEGENIKLSWSTPINGSVAGYKIIRHKVNSDGSISNTSTTLNEYPIDALSYTDYNVPDLNYYYRVAAVSEYGRIGIYDTIYTYRENTLKDGFPVNYRPRGVEDTDLKFTHDTYTPVLLKDIDNDGKDDIFTAFSGVDNNYCYTNIVAVKGSGEKIMFEETDTIKDHSNIKSFMRGAISIDDLNNDGTYQMICATSDTKGTPSPINKYNFEDGLFKLDTFKLCNGAGHYASYGSIITNLDENKKDKSIIVRTSPYSWNNNGSRIHIYDKDLKIIQSLTDSLVYEEDQEISIELKSFGRIAIADVNNDCKKEIFAACSNEKDTTYLHKGIYMWSMEENGKYYGKRIYTNDSVQFCSDIVIGDIDGDLQKEIIFAAKMNKNNKFTFYILKKDIENNYYCYFSQYVPYDLDTEFKVLPLSLGDITGDNILDVVFTSYLYYTLNNKGEKISYCGRVYKYSKGELNVIADSIDYINPIISPLIADVDGDGMAEIIVQPQASEGTIAGKIYAYNYDGTEVKGFPINLRTNFTGSIAAGDIDGDGKTELVGGSYRSIYAWDTEGDASLIEWGMAHGNYPSTGEYINNKKYTTLKSNTTIDSLILKMPMVIPSGLTYRVTGELTSISDCGKQANSITILEGGSLIIDGGVIRDAFIKVCSGGILNIINGGVIDMTIEGEQKIDIEQGAIFNLVKGIIK